MSKTLKTHFSKYTRTSSHEIQKFLVLLNVMRKNNLGRRLDAVLPYFSTQLNIYLIFAFYLEAKVHSLCIDLSQYFKVHLQCSTSYDNPTTHKRILPADTWTPLIVPSYS